MGAPGLARPAGQGLFVLQVLKRLYRAPLDFMEAHATRSMSALHGHTGSGKNRCPEPSLLPNAPMSFVPQPVVLASECVSLSFCTLIHWDHITVLYVRSNDPPLA